MTNAEARPNYVRLHPQLPGRQALPSYRIYHRFGAPHSLPHTWQGILNRVCIVPTISCIIPVLNGMPYLKEALASLEAQTYSDFETLVWDNGSTDGTQRVLRQWIPTRLPGRVFTGTPLSLGNSLHRLTEESHGTLIARMDADDVCEPNRFETQVAHMTSHPDHALVASDRTCIDEHGQEFAPKSQFPEQPEDILHATLRGPRILHPTATMRRDALAKAGGYRDLSTPDCPYWCEDYDLWLRFLAQYRAVSLPLKLLRYRDNPKGVTRHEMKRKRAAIARREAWKVNAQDFVGIRDSRVSMELWDKQLWFALPVLHRIAGHFCKLDGITPANRWRLSSFSSVANSFVRREDLATRLFLRMVRQVGK